MSAFIRLIGITLVVWAFLLWLLLGKAALQPVLDVQMHNTYFVLHDYWGQLGLFVILLGVFAFAYTVLRILRKTLK